VLTASDPQFIDRFPGRVESIKLHTPQLVGGLFTRRGDLSPFNTLHHQLIFIFHVLSQIRLGSLFESVAKSPHRALRPILSVKFMRCWHVFQLIVTVARSRRTLG
jgi:hypothetical protein